MTASMGGVDAYREILADLPHRFPAALVLVQHRPVRELDTLVRVLQYRSVLPVRLLKDEDRLVPGVVHVVPAGHWAAFSAGGAVTLHPADDHCAADPTFASAADVYGPRLVAAVLTGRLQDGALGVRHVRGAGGRVLAQDRATSKAFGMPGAAMATGCIDFVLPLPVLVHALVSLVMVPGAAGMMRVPLPPWAAVIPPVMAT